MLTNKNIPITILSLLGVVATSSLLIQGYFLFAFVLFIFLAGTIFIFIKKSAYPFRFLYPGILTFLFFMIIPIFFTIYVGFTNLSTGHFLTKDRVKEILLSEVVIDDSSQTAYFELYKNKDGFTLSAWTESEQGKSFYLSPLFSPQQSTKSTLELIKQETRPNLQSQKKLSRGDIFDMRGSLKKTSFSINSLDYSYFRTDKLLPLKSTFSKLPNSEGLLKVSTNEIYLPNDTQGFYSHNKTNDVLAPGYFVNVGFDNFTKVFNDPNIKNSFFKIFTWTFLWALFSVALTFSLGTFLAIVINDKALKMKRLYRILLVIPYSIPFFISILTFKGLLNKDFGMINQLLSVVGIGAIPWLDHHLYAKFSCLLANLWLGFPYMFLVVTGILQSIPQSVYEAAKIDGVSTWKTFKGITLPLIMSAVLPLLVGSFAFNLNNFVGIYLLTGGGPPIPGAITPAGETDILVSYTYKLAFEGAKGQDFGLASSISIFIFVIISILTIINFRLSKLGKDVAV
jgi:maltose/maltodextrin transport system permease protein